MGFARSRGKVDLPQFVMVRTLNSKLSGLLDLEEGRLVSESTFAGFFLGGFEITLEGDNPRVII